MLEHFLAIEVDASGNPLPPEQCLHRKLFAGGEVVVGPKTGKTKQLAPLKIAQQCPELLEDYHGQYPVISLTLKGVKGMGTYEATKRGVNKQINGLFKKHNYLLKSPQLSEEERTAFKRYAYGISDDIDLADSLRFLSELLHQHFGRPAYVLIDEYDTPIHSAYLKLGKQDPEQLEQVLEFFRTLLGAVLKTNPHLKQGLITGILRIAKANLFSDLNNVSEYTLLDEPFSPYYGFTEEEVATLMQQVPTKTCLEEIRHWYNGYTFGGQDVRMYNPWSIMRCLANKGKLDHYWIDSGGMSLLDEALLSDELQQELQTLVAGGSLEKPIYKQIRFEDLAKLSGLYSLLLFSGYLNPKLLDGSQDLYQLSIPNYEVQFIYERRVLDWVSNQLDTDLGGYYTFVSLLTCGKVEAFRERLQEMLQRSTSFHQVGERRAELFYSGFVLAFISMLSGRYYIESEPESGLGRPDALLIP
ncbi:MAG: ATP-binding protein, partial [Cytophagales bacterium]|nr:ATP-binding protein [Cytophagales bacterium]